MEWPKVEKVLINGVNVMQVYRYQNKMKAHEQEVKPARGQYNFFGIDVIKWNSMDWKSFSDVPFVGKNIWIIFSCEPRLINEFEETGILNKIINFWKNGYDGIETINVIFEQAWEGELKPHTDWLNYVHTHIPQKFSKFIHFINADVNLKESYEKRFTNTRVFGNLHSFPFYWGLEYKHLVSSGYVNQVKTFNPYRSKHYICLNAFIKLHRALLLFELDKNQLEEYGYISALGRYMGKFGSTMKLKIKSLGWDSEPNIYLSDSVGMKYLQHFERWVSTRQQLRKLDMGVPQMESVWMGDKFIPLKQMEDSWVNVVVESIISQNNLFVTEKTWKAFVNYQIPLVFGCRGINKYLKSLGYDLFEDIFDLSYDDGLPHERLFGVVENIKKLCSMDLDNFIQYEERLQKNRELFFNTDYGREEKLSMIGVIK